MKVLLQNTRTGKFFHSQDEWTDQIEAARDFGGTEAALTFATRESIPHVQMVLKFEGEDYNLMPAAPEGEMAFVE